MSASKHAVAAIVVLVALFAGCSRPPKASTVFLYRVSPAAGQTYDDQSLAELATQINYRLQGNGKAIVLENGNIRVTVSGSLANAEMKAMTMRIGSMGRLTFRILADSTVAANKSLIEDANRLPPTERIVEQDGQRVAEWVLCSEEFADIEDGMPGIIRRQIGDKTEALVVVDQVNVNGQYLRAVRIGESNGRPELHVSFDAEGANRMGTLSGNNLPDSAGPGSSRRLGILLDDTLIQAPQIRERITQDCVISGGSLSPLDLEAMEAILNGGSLPLPIELVQIEELAR